MISFFISGEFGAYREYTILPEWIKKSKGMYEGTNSFMFKKKY